MALEEEKHHMSDELRIIEKTFNILNKVNWAAYGDHEATDYLAYIQGEHGDEISLMDGLLGEFLEQVLSFTLHKDLLPQMTTKATGERPDYIPDDTHLHPFVFDAKGTDTTDLDEHYDQITRYMRSRRVRYGVLANMRDLAVYTLHSRQREGDYSFSFSKLYEDYQRNPTDALGPSNTKRFLSFVQRFRRRELDEAGKIQAIIDARHGPHDAALDLDELVRGLHEIVAVLREDVRQQRGTLPQRLHYKNDRKEIIALEIDTIAREIDPAMPAREVKANTIKLLLGAPNNTTDGQASDRYFYRVAYFAMTRVLLARIWEDIGFIEQTLYDGGFEKWYQDLHQQICEVLDIAFLFAGKRYSWLYGVENNYTWYTPSEGALVDVLYDFSRFDFRHLDADVLGAVYEAYLDRTDRKNKGQYYTPRPIVQFIWDRVGFDTPAGILRFEGGERKPRVILDFCTGSGGFLVEAARRIRKTLLGSSFDPEDPACLEDVSLDDLTLVKTAIIEGLWGSEISAFAYYLTEVNLLIQLTPIIAAIRIKAPDALSFGPDYALSVIHQDSLKLHDRQQPSLITAEGELVADFTETDEVYEEDPRHDIVSLSGYKRTVYNRLKDERADYVCSNPPYVGEKGRKELFRYVRQKFPYWKLYYQGKMDYLYWFIILGLSKLRDGGRLGYITTSYWPTADGAAKLRRYILKHAKILEIIDFGETHIFSDAPGQHNMVFVLERCDDEKARATNRPWRVEVRREFEGDTIEDRLCKLLDHIRTHIDTDGYEDDYIVSFKSNETQESLSSGSWAFTRGRVHNVLELIMASGPGLATDEGPCNVNCGAQSGADKVSNRNITLLPAAAVGDRDIRVRDGIFVVTEKEARYKNLLGSSLVKRLYKNSDIVPYIVDATDSAVQYLIYTDDDVQISDHPDVEKHLMLFRPILEPRRECQAGRRLWSSLQWPRKRAMFEGPKVLNPQRAPRNIFAYSDVPIYTSVDVYYTTLKRGTLEDLRYVCALLNSAICAFWLAHKGKKKGHALELYYGPLSQIPIRRIRFDPPTDKAIKQAALDTLKGHLDSGDYDAAYTRVRQALDTGQEDVVHDGLAELVDQILTLKTDLAAYNRYFGTRLTRLEESDPLPEMNAMAVLQELPAIEQWSVDIHIQNRTLAISEHLSGERDDFYFYRIKESDDASITLRGKGSRADTLTLSGDPALIGYLKVVLPQHQEQFWREAKNTLVPKDLGVYQGEVKRIVEAVTKSHSQVAGRQSVIDRIVLDLYGISDLEDRKLVMANGVTK